jgi:hypothetical protein
MAILKKTLFAENLERFNVLVEDTDTTSRYFGITELPDTFTGGKNAFLIQGSPELVADTIIKIEIKDSQGNIIYHEPGEGIPEYYEGTSKVVAVYVYPDTAFGPCTITILGELKEYVNNGFISPIPENWENQYNVRWQGVVNVNPFLANTTKIRFYRRPKIDITESVLPVYNRVVYNRTISGSVSATAISPTSGSDYRSFKGITLYELEMSGSSNFSQSMENVTMSINVGGNTYTPIIKDVTTNKKAYVNVPYYESSSLAPNYYSVTSFDNQPFTLTYEESEILSNSNVSSSFAVIKIKDLESFSGDPARIRVYASSKQDLGDYQLLEDIQLESNELFLERVYENKLNVRTGIFTETILNNFWVSQSMDSSVITSIDNSLMMKAVKLQPVNDFSSSTGLFCFHYETPLEFSKNTEYQLDFTPILSSSVSGYGGLEVYLSGSAFANTHNSFGKEIYNEETNTSFRKYEKQQVNFKPDNDGFGQVKFVVNGGTWELANISLRASHESYFSPNEIELIADVPTKINNETFDFRFELYDINNNHVPILLEKTYTFTGGNDIRIKRDLAVTTTFNSFNFNTGSAFPSSINIDYTTTGLTGSITFTSQAVDTTGQGITTADLTMGSNYPGLLNYIDVDTRQLTIENFTGSLSGGKKVGALIYTASVENINRYFTIFRVEQGAPSYLFYANADKNSFTFDPDDNYKSMTRNDYIDIRLVQQNLPSISGVGLTISSGSEVGSAPPLYYTGSIGNASVYRLFVSSSGDTTPSNKNGYVYGNGQSTYDFQLNTINGYFTSSVTIDANVRGDKGKGLIATSDKNQFFYKMTDLAATPSSQTATILVKRQNLGSLTNSITVTKSGSGPNLTLTSNNIGNGVAQYTVNTADYTYGLGTTTYTFSAVDLNGTSYSDQITISPVISESQISANYTNENASLGAYSTGFIPSASFLATSGSVLVKVGTESITNSSPISNNTFSASISASIGVSGANITNAGVYSITSLNADSGSVTLKVVYQDGRGTQTTLSKDITYSKAKAGTPNVIVAVSPSAQSIVSNSRGSGSATPTTLTITALEGGTNRFTSIGTPTYTNGLAGTVSTNTITFTSTASSMYLDTGQVTIPVNYTDSEGSSGTKNIVATISKAKTAAPTTLITTTAETQTITSSSVGFASPSPFTIVANEGSSNYSYASSGNSTFQISSVINGTNSSGTITPSAITTTAGSVVTASISYINSEGSVGSALKYHKIAVAPAGVNGTNGTNGFDGGAGPGVVYRGEYSAKALYYSSSFRRDIVSYASSYYLSNVNGTTAGTPPTGWTAFGAQFSSVATDILLAQDATITRGLVMGGASTTNSVFMRSVNATAINTGAGFYISGSGVARFGDPAGQSIYWNGSTLDVTGNINISGGNACTLICGAQATANSACGNAATAQSTATHACNCSYTALSRTVNSDGKITFNPTPTGAGLFMNSSNLGFYCNSVWKTYMSSGGCFYLAGAGGDGLTWDTCNLTINGNINITGGTAATQISNAASCGINACAAALSANTAAGAAQTTATSACNNAAAAQSTATHACSCSYTALSRSVDSVGKITFAPTPAGNGLFLSSTNMGFYCCTVWKTYMNSGGCFYLSGCGSNSLTWDTNNLVICGNGVFSGTITSSCANLGGWVVNSNSIFKGCVILDSSVPEIKMNGARALRIGTLSVYDGTCIDHANSTYIGDGGLVINGSWCTGADAPEARIRMISREAFTSMLVYNNTVGATQEPIGVSAYGSNSTAAIRIYNGGLLAANTATGTYLGNGNSGYAIQSAGNLYVSGTGQFTGDVAANTSDKRLKTNIKNIDSPLDKLDKINGVYFNWNELAKELTNKNTDIREIGFLAQEVQSVLPEIIKHAPFDRILDENVTNGLSYISKSGENYLTIQYEKIVPLLVEAIKQLKRELDELKCKR